MDTNTDKEFFEWHEASLRQQEQEEVASRIEQSTQSKATLWLQTRAEARHQAQVARDRFHYQNQYGENLLFRALGLAASFGMCFIALPSLYGFFLWMASGGNR